MLCARQPMDDPEHFLHEIARLAQAHDIDIVAGTAVEAGHHQPQHRAGSHAKNEKEEEQTGHKLFNTCYYVGRDGDVKGRYTKRVRVSCSRVPATRVLTTLLSAESLASRTSGALRRDGRLAPARPHLYRDDAARA